MYFPTSLLKNISCNNFRFPYLSSYLKLIKASDIVLAITCQPPVSSEAPHILTDKETYNYNETIQFSCSEGFFLQANQERNCTKNGPLKPPYPNCKGTDIC